MPPSYTTPPLPGSSRGLGTLAGDVLRRPGGRRAVSVLSIVLFLAGIAMFAYPVITDFIAHGNQQSAKAQFDDPSYRQQYRLHQIKVGQGLTRLQIPKLNVDVLVVEGDTPAALRAGAGHYPGTPLPGEAGNVAIAGHRTTYGRPFSRLDEMGPGDTVLLETPFDIYTYTAVPAFAGHPDPWVVLPTDFGVISQTGADHWLTLTTCTPKGSASHRLILRLTLTKTVPRPPASATSKS